MDTRTADKTTQLKEFVDRAFLKLNTAIPGNIVEFDETTQTASIQPGVQMKLNIDGVEQFLNYPLLINVPICMPMNQSWGITFPINTGDPCLLIFAQRAIDNWVERGGIQPPEDGIGSRHHDITDAVAVIAPQPIVDVFSNWETDGLELRNKAKDIRVTLKDTLVEVIANNNKVIVNKTGDLDILGATKVHITAPTVEITGNLTVSGDISSTGGDVSDSIESMAVHRATYISHTHNENGDGGGVTDPPN